MDNGEMVPCHYSLMSSVRVVIGSLFRLVHPPPTLKMQSGKGICFSSHVHNVVRLIEYVSLILIFCANELMRVLVTYEYQLRCFRCQYQLIAQPSTPIYHTMAISITIPYLLGIWWADSTDSGWLNCTHHLTINCMAVPIRRYSAQP